MTTTIGSEVGGRSRLLGLLLREPAPLRQLASRSSYPWLVVATVCIGAFMGQLDASIVSLVLPTLEDHFQSPVSQVQWVAIIYLLVLTGLLTPLGRVADQLGRKTLYTFGFVVFTVGSALCGLAPHLGLLIVARAVQGTGAALLQANSVAIITTSVPRDRLGRAIGLQGSAQALGLAVGPSVGGLLISWLGWHWVFLINLPVGAVAVVMAIVVLPRSIVRRQRVQLNWLGALLLPVTIGLGLLALSFIEWVYLLAPLVAAGAVGFAWSERRSPAPLVVGRLLRAPGLLAGLAAALLSYGVLFGGLFAIPILLERVFAKSPAASGLILTLVPAVLASVALAGGLLSDAIGPRVPAVAGMLLAATGLGLAWWGADLRLGWLIPGLILLGLGSGLFIPANNSAVMATAPVSDLGVAGGLLNTMRGLGTSLGVTLVGLLITLFAGTDTGSLAAPEAVLSATKSTALILAVAALAAVVLVWRRTPASQSDSMIDELI